MPKRNRVCDHHGRRCSGEKISELQPIENGESVDVPEAFTFDNLPLRWPNLIRDVS